MPIFSVITPTFLISDWKKIKIFKTSQNNKNSISFSHIKFLLILFFAQKMMEFWLFFLSCFWGPQNLLGPSKKTQLLDSWPLGMPQKTRPWAGLVWKKCPVSTIHDVQPALYAPIPCKGGAVLICSEGV